MRTITLSDRDQWLAARRGFIGASDSPAIIGVGVKTRNIYTVWEEKTGRRGPEEDDDDDLLLCGRHFQPGIKAIAEAKWGMEIEDLGEFAVQLDDQYEWLACTLDGRTFHDQYGLIPVEFKNQDYWMAKEWREGAAPLGASVQIQQQMRITGARAGYLIAVIGGNKPVRLLVERDDEFLGVLVEQHLKPFWDYVQRDEPPPPNDTIECAQFVARLHPEDSGDVVELGPEAGDWKEELKAANRDLAAAGARKLAIENKLRAAIGSATYAVLPDGSCFSWKTQDGGGFYVEPHTKRVLRPRKALPREARTAPRRPPGVNGNGEVLAKRRSSYKHEREMLYQRHPHCHWCGKKLTKRTATLEHVVPLSRGGADREENWALACKECNRARGNLN